MRWRPRCWVRRPGPPPATGLAAALAVGLWVRESGQREDLELARHLDLLENYVEVASLGAVELPRRAYEAQLAEALKVQGQFFPAGYPDSPDLD